MWALRQARLEGRDDHYPVYWLDIRQDSEFATGYGYPKTTFKREPDTDIRDAFIDISRIQTLAHAISTSRTFRGMRSSKKKIIFTNQQKQSSFLYSKSKGFNIP